MTPIDFIKQQNWKVKISGNGDELSVPCPFASCPNYQEYQFYINRHTGAWYCHRTPAEKGNNIKQLAFKLGLVTLQLPVKSTHIFVPEIKIEQYNTALLNTPQALRYLYNIRGLNTDIIKLFKLGYTSVYGSPAIVIPYFDKTNSCVGMKYDFFTRLPGVEKYLKETGTKTQFFNLQLISIEHPIVITEGEYDAMSLWQYGIVNAGSMPNGASGINGWIEDIELANEFLICTDNDSAGQEAAERLGKILGLSKCKRVYPRLKDVNDYLQHGLPKSEIDKIFKQAEPMFKAPVIDIENYKEAVIEAFNHPELMQGVSTGWKSVDYYLGGIRTGEVTVVSGLTGHGKSSLALALIINLVNNTSLNCLIISPEMKEESLLMKLVQGQAETKTPILNQIEDSIGHYKQRVFIANVFDLWTNKKKTLLQSVFDTIDYAVRNHNIQFVLLDHLRLFLNPKEQEAERFAIDEFMQSCVHSVIKNNIHIWLVVQPKNIPSSQRRVTMNDLKGSSNISQDAHNIILIHRNLDVKKAETLVNVEVTKNRFSGRLGTTNLYFNKVSEAGYTEQE